MENVKVSEMQLKVLKELAEHYHNDEANVLYIRTLAKETGLPYAKARLAVRALARKGLAEYVRGLFDLDGMVAGSGYMATFKGTLLVAGCHNKETCGNLADMVTGECQNCWEARRVYEFTADHGKYKKGDKATKAELGDDFKPLYWGTLEKNFEDKKIIDCTPNPEWVCQECGNLDCVC